MFLGADNAPTKPILILNNSDPRFPKVPFKSPIRYIYQVISTIPWIQYKVQDWFFFELIFCFTSMLINSSGIYETNRILTNSLQDNRFILNLETL